MMGKFPDELTVSEGASKVARLSKALSVSVYAAFITLVCVFASALAGVWLSDWRFGWTALILAAALAVETMLIAMFKSELDATTRELK